jgi:hypothetical protein
MTVGLNSNLNEDTFKRNPMNLLICIDKSGSMSSPFDHYHYDEHHSKRYVDSFYPNAIEDINSFLVTETKILLKILVQKC